MNGNRLTQYRRNNTLSYRLLFLILTCSSIFTLLGTALQLYLDYREDVQSIEEGFVNIRDSFLQPLTVSLWNFDTEQIKTQAKGMIALPDMKYITIKELRGEQEVVIMEMGELPGKETLTREYNLEYEKDSAPIKIGSLVVTASLSNVYRRIRAKVFLVLVTQATKTFFVSILILLIFHFLIMRHLNTIALHLKEVSLERLTKPLRLKRKSSTGTESDLLDGLVIAINEMQTRLINDYTARESAERELRISQERYRKLFEFSPVSIWQFDLSGIKTALKAIKQNGFVNLDEVLEKHPDTLDQLLSMAEVVDVNGTTLGIFEAASREQLIRSFPALFGGKESPVCYKLIHAVWQDLPYFEMDFEGVTLKGRPVSAMLQWYIPLSDEQPGLSESVLALTDMTERKKIEEVLIQSEKMASLGGMAAGMAHELNNPLGIMLQASQNIERRTSPDLNKNREVAAELSMDMHHIRDYMNQRGILRYVAEIREAGMRAARIIKNMLHFSRNSDSEATRVNINQVLDRSIELANNDYDLKKNYDFRSITINRQYQSDLEDIRVVETEIEQVLLNLLKNAAQSFNEQKLEQAPEIRLRTASEKGMILIEISDNGPGMTEEVRKRVFEPFFSTKPAGDGTGLGLSVSYMIITNNHKGNMSVVSELGKGTSFRIQLPVNS